MSMEEVTVAFEKKRHELVLSGPTASEVIEKEGLDERVYSCQSLNFLDISGTCLNEIKSDIGKLVNLTNLVLRGNQLSAIPIEVGHLAKLKLIDISRNKISSLPNEINKLNLLHSLHASFNELEEVPELTSMENLSILDLSHNKLQVFPSFDKKSTTHLSEILLNDNVIAKIPMECGTFPSIKILDICNNKLTDVPGELGNCLKLKEIRLKDNKLKDRRLLKLVDQCHYKQVLEYIRSHCAMSSDNQNAEISNAKGKQKGKKKKGGNEVKDVTYAYSINVIHVKDDTPVIKCSEQVKEVRPYIIGCIVRNVDLQDVKTFKSFITLQTKLHETACEKRTIATIATHDLNKISGNILYGARDPNKIMIQPLMKTQAISTAALYQQLRDEAEALRKEKKRNTFSGVHKYLYLLDHKAVYPCLRDQTGAVISFPPITNSDLTKISSTTTNLFIEVTSSTSLNVCKQVMDKLIMEMLKGEIGVTPSESTQALTLEQVRVEDDESNLKVVYPSRTDLHFENVNVIHE